MIIGPPFPPFPSLAFLDIPLDSINTKARYKIVFTNGINRSLVSFFLPNKY